MSLADTKVLFQVGEIQLDIHVLAHFCPNLLWNHLKHILYKFISTAIWVIFSRTARFEDTFGFSFLWAYRADCVWSGSTLFAYVLLKVR